MCENDFVKISKNLGRYKSENSFGSKQFWVKTQVPSAMLQ